MPKTRKAVSLIIAMSLLLCMIPTAFAQTIAPRAGLITGVDLWTNSSGKLAIYAFMQYGTPATTTVYTMTLERKVNGSWEYYDSWGGSEYTNYLSVSKEVSPPTGYRYRVKVAASSPAFPDIKFSSREYDY